MHALGTPSKLLLVVGGLKKSPDIMRWLSQVLLLAFCPAASTTPGGQLTQAHRPSQPRPAAASVLKFPMVRSFFVSPRGSDVNDGTAPSAPFKTVGRAQKAVRAARAAAPAAAVVVNLRGGTYSRSDGGVLLALELADSGTAEAPVVWRSYPGEDVLLSAGAHVPPAAFTRRQGHLQQLQANLTALGLTDLGRLGQWDGPSPTAHNDSHAAGPYPAPLQGRRGWNGVQAAELFWDGQPATLARWPNVKPDVGGGSGGSFVWARTAGGYPPNCAGTSGEPQPPTAGARPVCTGFTSSAPFTNSTAQLEAWAAEAAQRDPALHGYWSFDWNEKYLPLVGVNVSARAMVTTNASDPSRAFPYSDTYYSFLTKIDAEGEGGCAAHDWTHCRPGARWYALNLLSELDAQNEYYIERSTRSDVARQNYGLLYVHPPTPAARGAASADGAVLSMGQQVVTLGSGVAFVTFEGLRIGYSRDTAVKSLGPVANITIRNCTVANTGAGAIGLVGAGIEIAQTEVYGTAAFGITIKGGKRDTLQRSYNLIQGCEVHHTARLFRTGQPGLHWVGVGNTFRENHVHHMPHYAVMGGANQATCTFSAQLFSWPPIRFVLEFCTVFKADQRFLLPGAGTTEMGWGRPPYVPDDLGICGSAANVFEGNLIEDAVYECDDSGSFNTCGQEGTAFTNPGNVLRNNTFRRIRMRPSNDDGSGVLVGGNPIVSAVYFDAAMSGWVVEGNSFIDCMLGVFVNGGCDHVIKGNYFEDTDHAIYMGGDSCYNPMDLVRIPTSPRDYL